MTDHQNFGDDDDIPNYIDFETVQQMLRESAMQKDVNETPSVQNPADVEESINEKQYIDMDSVRNLLENFKTLSKTENNENPSTADVIGRPTDVISQPSGAPTVSAVVVIGDNDDLSQPIYAKVNKRSSLGSTEPTVGTLLRTPLPTVPEVKKERPKTFPKPPKLPQTRGSTTDIVVSASEPEVAETSDDPTYDVIPTSAMDSPSIGSASNLTVIDTKATAEPNDFNDDEDDTYASIGDYDDSKQNDISQQMQQEEERKENDADGDDNVETPYATRRVHSIHVDPSKPELLSESTTGTKQGDDVLPVTRFSVRWIGSVAILESDLVPTRSTPAVIECITSLITSYSRFSPGSTHSIWPTDKDVYLELRDTNLNIVDSTNLAILSSQSLSTIRKWGSHQHANSRCFAYVSRDRSTAGNRFKCHVFQTDSADQITTTLREICWKMAAKRTQNGSNTTLPRDKSELMT